MEDNNMEDNIRINYPPVDVVLLKRKDLDRVRTEIGDSLVGPEGYFQDGGDKNKVRGIVDGHFRKLMAPFQLTTDYGNKFHISETWDCHGKTLDEALRKPE